jgi:hypothetical protein
LIDAAHSQLCADLKGKEITIEDGRKYCSWPDKATCEGSFKWVIGENNKTDHYATWDAAKGECDRDPLSQTMRGYCENAKWGYDPVKQTCLINKDYCLGKSMQYDESKNKCTISKGQEVAEMMFGTTMVRGLNQFISKDQYEPCPPGARPAYEVAAEIGAACAAAGAFTFGIGAIACSAVMSAWALNTMCAWDKCAPDQDKISGLCYAKCKKATEQEKAQGWSDFNDKAADTKGAEGVKIQGMCYRCPPGYFKSSPGMCEVEKKTDLHGQMSKCPSGFKDTGLFCNVDTYNIGIGTPKVCQKTAHHVCHTKRPWICSGGEREDIDGLCYKKCKPGDIHVPGMPYLCRKPGGLLVQEKIKMGVCPPDKEKEPHGAMCYKKCSDYGPGWHRTAGPTCSAKQWGGLDVIATAGKSELSYSRKPEGISYKLFQKKRKIPYGKGPHGC